MKFKVLGIASLHLLLVGCERFTPPSMEPLVRPPAEIESPMDGAAVELPEMPKCETETSCVATRDRPYTAEELSGLRIAEAELVDGGIRVVLENNGSWDILPRSTPSEGSHLKLSWGYAAADVEHPGYFGTRFDFIEGIRPGRQVEFLIPAEIEVVPDGKAVWVVALQENVFWLHDAGVPGVMVTER